MIKLGSQTFFISGGQLIVRNRVFVSQTIDVASSRSEKTRRHQKLYFEDCIFIDCAIKRPKEFDIRVEFERCVIGNTSLNFQNATHFTNCETFGDIIFARGSVPTIANFFMCGINNLLGDMGHFRLDSCHANYIECFANETILYDSTIGSLNGCVVTLKLYGNTVVDSGEIFTETAPSVDPYVRNAAVMPTLSPLSPNYARYLEWRASQNTRFDGNKP